MLTKAAELLRSYGVSKEQLMVNQYHNRYFFMLNTNPIEWIFVSPTQDGRTSRPLQYGLDFDKATKVYKAKVKTVKKPKAPWHDKKNSSSSRIGG